MKKLETIKPKTLSEVVKHSRELPKIWQLLDNEEVKKTAAKAIIEVFEFYNESLTPIQLPLLLDEFLNQAKNLTFAEIDIFRGKCLAGTYDLKFRLTPNVFIDWLKEYKFERMEAFATINTSGYTTNQVFNPRTLELLKNTFKPSEPEPSETKPTDNPEIKAKVIELSKEFDKLNLDQGSREIKGFSYVEINGKNYLKSEFIKLKFI